MKTLNIYAALIFSIFTINISFAQSTVKEESIKVLGNCGMCKNKIEKAAKSAGATFADWNSETKFLNVSYNPSSSNAVNIQKAIAASGYETQDVKADINAYNKLHGCCKYDRTSLVLSKNCCAKEKKGCGTAMSCGKDGKCDGKANCSQGKDCRKS